jgi:RNA polymerase sigma-70 factor (ECF subfamily)
MADDSDLSGRGGTQSPLSTASSLILGLKSHDTEAWSRMVELYFPLVYGWCQRGGLPAEEIRDVIQDVFRAVASGVNGLRHERPEDTFRGWLKGITQHKIQDYWRRQPAEGRGVGGSNAQQQLHAAAIFQTDDASASDVSDRALLVNRALDLIRVEFEAATWQAFWRTTVDGDAPADVAADLNLTVNAVYKAKSRIIRRLREVLGDCVE